MSKARVTDAKPVAELRREAQARRREWSGKMFEVYGRPLDKHVREVREAEVATEAAIDLLAEAAESRTANEIAARQRAQEHGIGDRARIEELERERDDALKRGQDTVARLVNERDGARRELARDEMPGDRESCTEYSHTKDCHHLRGKKE